MAESERERKRREKQERIDMVNRLEKKRRDEERQEQADNAAAREARQMGSQDERFIADFMDLIGETPEETEANIQAAENTPERRKTEEILRAAEKAAKGGWLTSGDPKKARRIIKQHRKMIKRQSKAGKKKRGCLAALAVLGLGAAGLFYGMYEGVTAIASALF